MLEANDKSLEKIVPFRIVQLEEYLHFKRLGSIPNMKIFSFIYKILTPFYQVSDSDNIIVISEESKFIYIYLFIYHF